MAKKKYRLVFFFALVFALSISSISHAMNNHGLGNSNVFGNLKFPSLAV